MRKQFWFIVLVVLLPVASFGQGSTTHLFPQVAHGTQTDGTFYVSIFWITNISASSADCVILPSSGLTSRVTSSGTIPAGASTYVLTTSAIANEPLATGYVRLTCTEKVEANVQYYLADKNSHTLGAATVPSAPASTYALIPAFIGNRHYGLAIANDSDAAIAVNIAVGHSRQSKNRTISIPARSQYVKFIEEAVDGLDLLEGFCLIEVTSLTPFYLTGLLFDGAVFTTLLPVFR